MPLARLRATQVNSLLEALVLASLATGLISWTVGTGWARWWTVTHAISGLALVVLAPAKMQRSVMPGMRRRRATRWLSVLFGALVIGAASTGLLHATGAWYGVGLWSTLWIHVAVAFVLVPLFVWHVISRAGRRRVRQARVPHAVDESRRLLLGGAVALGAAGAIYAVQEITARVLGTAGGRRRFTGSHEVGSFDPDAMPTVSWIDDSAPDSIDGWTVDVDGRQLTVDELRALARPLDAALDCTGGWWSRQAWDVVPLALLADWSTSSIEVTSSTGYSRLLPASAADGLYLAVGYGGRALRRGHGAPVRLVAPGRRGPWWVKWVVSVHGNDRPWWLQLPLPLE